MASRKKTDRLWKLLLACIVASIAVMLFLWGYEWWLASKARYTRYDEFGIDIPTSYSVHGIDVSKYQNVIDWSSVKAMEVDDVRISFAFIKATEGNVNEDKYFKRNWTKARSAKLTRGAYHFFIATKSGKTQAENFISSVDLEPGDLPPVLDIEQTYGVSGTRLKQRVKEWLVTVEEYYGVKPIIYTNVDFYRQHLENDFDNYPLWVAHYINKGKPRIYRDWHFWQYSETGRVNGILSKVDFNVFNGDSAEFRRLLVN
ncbi:MAG: glycoside hydrolase family 25 protein [Chitinophagaceae bacterium]|nr:glycoside hydrolase family 25 protein [Chitinophagaceae bacterium]